MNKKCNKCGVIKPVVEFNKRGKNGFQFCCKECNKNKLKQYYDENKNAHIKLTTQRRKKRQKENQQKLRVIKSNSKCALCGENEPICLDFHHLSGKKIRISVAINCGWKWERVVDEMKKCVIVCSNCHRKIHIGKLKVDETMLYSEERGREKCY